jgi:uncharacterized protein (UPF0276 family)
MIFAINYSPQAVECLEKGLVAIDRFKTPDWPWMVAEARQYRPVAVHFNLVAGSGQVGKTDWDLVEGLLAETGTPYLNLHLEARLDNFPGLPAGTTLASHQETVYQQAYADVSRAVERVGPDRVIVENVPYRGPEGKVLRPCVEPALITRLVKETGCGLLFDLSHARIAAHSLRLAYPDYIDQLPMQSLREMHFTGMTWIDGKLTDHLAAQEWDWQALEWAVSCIRTNRWPEPWMLAFEYGGVGEKFAWRSEAGVIAAQVPEIRSAIASTRPPLAG